MTERRQRGGGSSEVYLFLTGVSFGWLAGLSTSPVIAPVLGAIVGALGGLIAGAKMIKVEGISLSPRPVAVLFLGMALAAPAGVLVRTHGLLAPKGRPAEFASPDIAAQRGALFTFHSDRCGRFLDRPPEKLRSALITSDLPWAPVLERRIADDLILRETVEEICHARF